MEVVVVAVAVAVAEAAVVVVAVEAEEAEVAEVAEVAEAGRRRLSYYRWRRGCSMRADTAAGAPGQGEEREEWNSSKQSHLHGAVRIAKGLPWCDEE